MTLLHCTQKLLNELGNPTLQTSANEPNKEGLGNWYANLLRIDRRKCILFTNEKTLYSFLIPRAKKENLKNIIDEFLLNLNMNLQAEGFPLEVINRVMQEYTDLGFESDYLILHRYEGIERTRILEVNKHINRSLMRGSRHLHPIEMLQELLAGEKVPRPRIRS